MAVDKVLNSVIDKAVSKVETPKLGGGLLGVKAKKANQAVQDAVKKTAERIGEEIQATYNKVIVTPLGGNKVQRTTLGLNEVTFETVEKVGTNAEYVSKYKRTTPRGTYEVETAPNGLTSHTIYTSPAGEVRDKTYIGGRVFRPINAKGAVAAVLNHNATKGRIVNHEKSTRVDSDYDYAITNKFENGNAETTYFRAEKPLYTYINFPKGDFIVKDLRQNISSYFKHPAKQSVYSFSPYAYHTNPKTGAVSLMQVEKSVDDFGRQIRTVKYELPSRTKFVNADFRLDDTNTERFVKAHINGEEITDRDQFYKTLYKILKDEDVSVEFTPQNKGWYLM